MKPSGCAIALLIMFLTFLTMGGVGRMAMSASWLMSQMLLPFLIVAVFLLLFRSQPRQSWHGPRQAYDRAPQYLVGTPEEVLRQRFARGEITHDQYQEAIIEILKGRYVTGELTIEEYEERVATLIADARPRQLDGEAPKGYL
jgi:uncharacterized membrane protein